MSLTQELGKRGRFAKVSLLIPTCLRVFAFGPGDFKIWCFMRVLQLKRLYIPALSILAVVLLMLILISISTYRNLERQEQTVLKFVHQQGLAILHTLEAGARAGMIMTEWEEDSIENLIMETGKNENIAYVYLIDSQGTVVHHSNPSFESMSSAWRPQLDNEDQVQSRVRKLTDGTQVYDLAKRFSPRQSLLMHYDHKDMMGHGKNIASHQHSDNIIILGLKMTAFEEARRSDIHHAMIMAAILVVLGSGAFFFYFCHPELLPGRQNIKRDAGLHPTGCCQHGQRPAEH